MNVAITPDGQLALAAVSSDDIQVWDLKADRRVDTLEISGHEAVSVADIVATADRWLILIAHWDTALVFDVRHGREVGARTLPFGNRLLRGVAEGITGVPDARIEAGRLSSDGQLVILGCMGSTLKLWDLKNGQVKTLTDQPGLARKIGSR